MRTICRWGSFSRSIFVTSLYAFSSEDNAIRASFLESLFELTQAHSLVVLAFKRDRKVVNIFDERLVFLCGEHDIRFPSCRGGSERLYRR